MTTERAAMKQFTAIKPVVMEGIPDAHNVFLIVGTQRFCISTLGCDTKDEAEWLQEQLCTALARIVELSK